MKTTNKAAYLRGQRFAIQWKRLVRTLRQWDNFWVHAARKRHLPTWTGRLPLALGLTGIVVCALFSITAVSGVWRLSGLLHTFFDVLVPDLIHNVIVLKRGMT